jgi:hypothetical protein
MKRKCLAMMLIAVCLAACGDSGTGAKPVAQSVSLPADLFAAVAPADAKSVKELRKDAKEGDQVVLTGRIAGRKDPFGADRAIVMVADRSLPTCDEGSPMDQCKTPWDFCCDEPKLVAANVATVQVVDASGKTLKAKLEGAGNLKPMAEVVVKGKVSKKDETTFVIDATSIFVKS